ADKVIRVADVVPAEPGGPLLHPLDIAVRVVAVVGGDAVVVVGIADPVAQVALLARGIAQIAIVVLGRSRVDGEGSFAPPDHREGRRVGGSREAEAGWRLTIAHRNEPFARLDGAAEP